jgi:YVTN family beta-propeller protein
MRNNWMLFGMIVLGVVCSTQADPVYRSPEVLVASPSGETLYITEVTSHTVAVMDVGTATIARRYIVSGPPSGLAVIPGQQRLIVTCATPKGTIDIIDLNTHKVLHRWHAGHTPMAPVVDTQGKRLYVCNRFNNTVSVMDLSSGRILKEIAVAREPVAAVLSKDGQFLMVANSLPLGRSDADYVAATISVIHTGSQRRVKSLPLPNGSTSLQGMCLSPNGKIAYVTHILARYHLPTTQLERGWMNTNALTLIDMEKQTLLNTVLLDNVDHGAANPWQPACTADGAYVCVTQAGSHELSVIDQKALLEKLSRVGVDENVSMVSKTPEDVPNDLSFLVGMRERLRLTGKGPRGLALIGDTAYLAEFFSDTVGKITITPNTHQRAQSLALGAAQPLTVRRTGHRLFNDASMCFQQWQSCSSCHPGEARMDGLNWDLLNDDIGNPKNTKSMLYSHRTPPAMSLGVRSTTEAAVRAGIRHIQFAVRPEEDAVALDTYLKSLKPVPSPHLDNGRLSRAAQQGKRVFSKAQCATCHSGDLFTDRMTYNLGTGTGRDKGKAFDTPALIELWRSGPYLHDGRAATLTELIKKHNPKDQHGTTSDLTDQEISALVAYLLSL